MADVVGEFFSPGATSLLESSGNDATSFAVEFFGAGSGSARQYVQRVYSSGLAAWCYYTESSIDPNPVSTATTPNWTGSITAHELLGSY